MKIVISPAKSLDFDTTLPTDIATQPQFLESALKVNKKMATLSKAKVGKLMHISDNLVKLNYQRYKDFNQNHTKDNSRQAVFAFAGDVYIGLDAYTIPSNLLEHAQDTLRILSGMYGLLKPLDYIQPYRLEMGTKIPIGRGNKNLYDFWKKNITQALNNELQDNELFLNLASQEYFKAIDIKTLKVPVISPVFKDYKNGNLKIISFFAKKARGTMARYCIDNACNTIEDIKAFDYDGYQYSQAHTEEDNAPVFIR